MAPLFFPELMIVMESVRRGGSSLYSRSEEPIDHLGANSKCSRNENSVAFYFSVNTFDIDAFKAERI